MAAGELRERVTFAKRSTASDGYGNTEGAFVDEFTVAARIMPLKGGEGVQAARLTGRQPVIIRVRESSDTLEITTAWKATDARSGAAYNITSVMSADEKGAYLDIMATTGEALG